MNKCTNNPYVAIDCDGKEKTINLDYRDQISPAAGLNEKELCNTLGFFSTKAPKKNISLKKVSINDLKNKRKRLENFFSSIDLDSWSERNFVFPNTKADNWHDDLHYIVLKQQEKSNFIHQLWLFLMLALFCIMLISIAGIIYSNKSVVRNADQTDSYEFIQKFINDFNHTEPRRSPDPANSYIINNHHNADSWLRREANYISKLLNARDNEPLNLTERAIKRSTEDNELRSIDNLNQVDYELIAQESTAEKIEEKIKEKFEDSLEEMKKIDLKKFLKKVQDMF